MNLKMFVSGEFYGVGITCKDVKTFAYACDKESYLAAAKRLVVQCDDAVAYYQQLKLDAEQLVEKLEEKE